jgi:hypothetical protein
MGCNVGGKAALGKGFGCRPLEERRREFGGRRPKLFPNSPTSKALMVFIVAVDYIRYGYIMAA